MDQVSCDSDCLSDRRFIGFDNRLRDIRLALGCVNGLTGWLNGRFAAIYSTFKSDTGTIPDAHSHRSACNESNSGSYTDTERRQQVLSLRPIGLIDATTDSIT